MGFLVEDILSPSFFPFFHCYLVTLLAVYFLEAVRWVLFFFTSIKQSHNFLNLSTGRRAKVITVSNTEARPWKQLRVGTSSSRRNTEFRNGMLYCWRKTDSKKGITEGCFSKFSKLWSAFNDHIVSFDFLTGKIENNCADTNFYNLVHF